MRTISVLLRHEMKQGAKALMIWSGAIGFFLVICVFMYPEMRGEMDGVSELFASMGAFSAAFGMDRLDFGTLIGFYAVECGNIIGIGGAFFTAFTAVSALANEEKEHTAEFLLSHPVKRTELLTGKLLAVMLRIVMLNVFSFGCAVTGTALIGEAIPVKELLLLHTACFIMQLELGGICFGISAFLRRGSAGIGLGLAAVMYFLNITANLSDDAAFLKYITPFGYTDGADIVTDGALDLQLILPGMLCMLIGIVTAYLYYTKKDIT